MQLTRVVLGVAGVPLLSGCLMLGGAGHTGNVHGVAPAVDGGSRELSAPFQRAEASSGSLTLALSFVTPRGGAAVTIDAQLHTDSASDAPTDGDVWLRIQAPGGGVDQFRMQRVQSSAAGTYQAEYRFSTAGLYLVTAEGRTGIGDHVRTVLVTTELEVGRGAASQVAPLLAGDRLRRPPPARHASVGTVARRRLLLQHRKALAKSGTRPRHDPGIRRRSRQVYDGDPVTAGGDSADRRSPRHAAPGLGASAARPP